MGKTKNNEINLHTNLPLAFNPVSRRMFLRGLGTTLALPLLPSLFSSEAQAADADYRKLVMMAFNHGVFWENWRPRNVTLTSVGNNVRAASLAGATLGGYFPSDFNSLKNKISVVEGLDHMCSYGHVRNAPFAAGGNKFGNDWEDPMSPNSIDVLLGKSSAFYPSAPKIPVLRTNLNGEPYSFHYENGNPQTVETTDPKTLFEKVSGAPLPPATGGKQSMRRKLMVDGALDSINKLLGSAKISTADRSVASNYFDHLRDVQTKVNAEVAGSQSSPVTGTLSSCGSSYTAPTDAASAARTIADTMVLALACGATKLSTMILPAEHDLVHRVDDPAVAIQHTNYLREESLFVTAYIMKKMDSIVEGNGKTMLENSLALVTSDSGSSKFDNHVGMNGPVILGGGLNGLLRMGQYVSYYDVSQAPILDTGYYPGAPLYGGRPYNDLMITIMRSLGMQSSAYRDPSNGGYGSYDRRGADQNGADSVNHKLEQYYANTYFPANPNRDVTLPYVYLGS